MKTYKTTITFISTDYTRAVEFRSAANTRTGVMRALGRYVAANFGTANFEANGLIVRDGIARGYSIGEWRTYGLNANDMDVVRKAAEACLA